QELLAALHPGAQVLIHVLSPVARGGDAGERVERATMPGADVGDPARDTTPEEPRPVHRVAGEHLDWHDAAAVREWLRGLRVNFKDLDATARDMLRLPWQRQLGPVFHRDHFREARNAIRTALAFAGPPDPEPRSDVARLVILAGLDIEEKKGGGR